MRVAHLVTGGELAGGQAVALQFAIAAREAGHEALFVSPTPGELVDRAAAEGFATEHVDVRRTTRLRGAARLARVLRRRDVDLLHTHVHAAANVLGRIAARASGAAVVSHLHIENHFRPSRLARAPLVGLDNATARLCQPRMMGRASQYMAGTVAIPKTAAGNRTVQSCSPSAATLNRSSSEFMRC